MKQNKIECLMIDWDIARKIFDEETWANSENIFIIPVDALSSSEREALCYESIPWHNYTYLISEL